MDTHDEEFGPLIRKQIEADKKAKENRDNTPGQGERPSNIHTPPSSLSYPLDVLVRHLVNEEEYINYGIPLHPNSRAAFEESKRLAEERIPQLRLAIKILLFQQNEKETRR